MTAGAAAGPAGGTRVTAGTAARPAVSVVVPFLNRGRYLAACVDALQRQTGVAGEVEIVLVDNGSTDGSAAIAARTPGVTCLEAPTPGVYAARNVGIRAARAPVLAFTDADCIVAPDWLRSIQRALAVPAAAVLLGRCAYPAEASAALRLLGAYENVKTAYVLDTGRPAQRFAYANNMAVRRSVFDAIGLFREWPRAADTELVHRLAARRPDLDVVYCDAMRVTHAEFLRAAARLRRLALYRRTNARIETFEGLGVFDRGRILWRMLRSR